MWAVGCILYELVLRRRIFGDDWEVLQYASPGGEHEIIVGADSVPDERKRKFILKVIKELLHVDPTRRPRANELYERFISWGSDSSAKRIGTVMQNASKSSDPNSEPAPTLPVDYAPPSTHENTLNALGGNNAKVEGTALQNFLDARKYSEILYPRNYGIALKNPSDDISVGDLCFWDLHSKATRILNIFENQEVCLSHSTMRLSLVS
jgi:hypothetical protein